MLCLLSTWLRRLPSAWLALLILVSISLSKEPSQDMVLPRYLKCSTLASGLSSIVMVGWEGVGLWYRLVEHLRLSKTDCQAKELGCLVEAVQHPLQVLFCAGKENLLEECLQALRLCCESTQVEEGAVQAIMNVDTHSSDLGQHGTAYRWKRRWRGPGLVRCPALRRCWSRKHPSHCHWRGPGLSCRHGRAWSSALTLEDTQWI